ncbi:ankyrin repeat protein, putative [Bodo saltans]|uniref:Ankyrin repeat protein, putative n=1 Tax=Bodo saltans TaxID=75058 RepID=A0A0S4J9C2_BODSA|nr:ankyrin repeat protein, putative [Bodo saltans]|eukprot:CUG86563.1 ankyrin repeat protein, putative [Bodo saltans]
MYAAQNGNASDVQSLVRKGADPSHANYKRNTPLHAAALCGDEDVIRVLVQCGADALAVNDDEETALLISSRRPSAAIIEVLVSVGADIHARDKRNNTPMMCAARYGNAAVVQFLVRLGADVNATNDDGRTALHIAVINGHTEVVDVLLKGRGGADVNVLGMVSGPLTQPMTAKVVELLVAEDPIVDEWRSRGRTPLMFAAERGNLDIVRLLVASGADVNVLDFNGNTALTLAAQYGAPHVIKFLLESGATLSPSNQQGSTPFLQASKGWKLDCVAVMIARGVNVNECDGDRRCTALMNAASRGNISMMRLLIKSGANVDAVNKNNETALHFAARLKRARDHRGKKDAMLNAAGVKLLLERAAVTSVRNSEGMTPLMIASQCCNTAAMRCLIEHAEEDNGVNDTDADGNTSMHHAVQYRLTNVMNSVRRPRKYDQKRMEWLIADSMNQVVECVTLLIHAGADCHATNRSKRSALMYAAQEGDPFVVKLLLEQGVEVDVADGIDNATALHFAARQSDDFQKALSTWALKAVSIHSIDVAALTTSFLQRGASCARLLLAAGAFVDGRDKEGCTATIMAAKRGKLFMIQCLEEFGADVNLVSRIGAVALHAAAFGGHLDVVRTLIGFGADVSPAAMNGLTVLHVASTIECAQALIDAGASTFARDNNGRTTLMYAAAKGDVATVRLFLKSGVDPNVTDKGGITALFLAAVEGFAEAVAALIEGGADFSFADENGVTALMRASHNVECAALLIATDGASLHTRCNAGRSAIHYAAIRGDAATIRLMVEKGADINLLDANGCTALMGAAVLGNEDAVVALVECGADVLIELKGATAMMCAAAENQRQCALILALAERKARRLTKQASASNEAKGIGCIT